jgi:hypothetical protein
MRDNRVFDNLAFRGGAIAADNASITLRSNIIENNQATAGGGALSISALVDDGGSTPMAVTNNVMVNNSARTNGGAIECSQAENIDITNNTIVANSALASGGGLYLDACVVTVTNNLVVSSIDGEGIFCTPTSEAALDFNDLFGNAGGDLGADCIGGLSDVSVDPALTTDFHLPASSAVINVGNNSAPSRPDQDFEGDPRISASYPGGTPVVIDLGADEFSCEDKDGDGLTRCTTPVDCDDLDPDISPYASEVCDGVDNDCNGLIDDGVDQDGDGDTYTTCGGDCNDSDASINPGAAEVCDGIDNNCNGAIDEGFGSCVPGAQAEIALSDAIGNPGDTVGVTSSLTILGGGVQVAATSEDIGFDRTILENVQPDCTINPAIGPGTAADKVLNQQFPSPTSMRVLVSGTNNNAIPAGDLFTCSFELKTTAPPGTTPLSNAASSSDPSGNPLPTNGLDGTITVLTNGGTGSGVVGDCDDSGTVSVAEVQLVINIFNGLDPVASCPNADANGDNAVDIIEVQNTIINHLTL